MNQKIAQAILEAGCYQLGPIIPSVNIKLALYPELRNLYSNPKHLELLAKELGETVKKLDVDTVAGGETAGIPLAVAISLKTKIPFVYVRKEAKTHGTKTPVHGLYKKTQTIALIDDLIAFGKAKRQFIENLKMVGLKPKAIVVILDIPRESREAFLKEGIKIFSLVNQKEMIEYYRKNKVWSNSLCDLLLDFEDNWQGWQKNKKKWKKLEELKKKARV